MVGALLALVVGPGAVFAHGAPADLSVWGGFNPLVARCQRSIARAASLCASRTLYARTKCSAAQLRGESCDTAALDASVQAARGRARDTVARDCDGEQLTALRYVDLGDAQTDVINICRQLDTAASSAAFAPASFGGTVAAMSGTDQTCVDTTSRAGNALLRYAMRTRQRALDAIAATVLPPAAKTSLIARSQAAINRAANTMQARVAAACPGDDVPRPLRPGHRHLARPHRRPRRLPGAIRVRAERGRLPAAGVRRRHADRPRRGVRRRQRLRRRRLPHRLRRRPSATPSPPPTISSRRRSSRTTAAPTTPATAAPSRAASTCAPAPRTPASSTSRRAPSPAPSASIPAARKRACCGSTSRRAPCPISSPRRCAACRIGGAPLSAGRARRAAASGSRPAARRATPTSPRPPISSPPASPSRIRSRSSRSRRRRAGDGLQMHMPAWTLQPKSESEVCFTSYYDFTGQIPADLLSADGKRFRYKSVEIRQDPLSHHLIVDVYRGDQPPTTRSWGTYKCRGGAKDGTVCDPARPRLLRRRRRVRDRSRSDGHRLHRLRPVRTGSAR